MRFMKLPFSFESERVNERSEAAMWTVWGLWELMVVVGGFLFARINMEIPIRSTHTNMSHLCYFHTLSQLDMSR